MRSSSTVSHGACIENGRVQPLNRNGLDWTGKYLGTITAGLPSFAATHAATGTASAVLVIPREVKSGRTFGLDDSRGTINVNAGDTLHETGLFVVQARRLDVTYF
jgi:hypothetical protein